MTTSSFAADYPWLSPYLGLRGIGPLVDHTLLKPEATESDIGRLADEAMELELGAVCVNGQWVQSVAERGARGRSRQGSGGGWLSSGC